MEKLKARNHSLSQLAIALRKASIKQIRHVCIRTAVALHCLDDLSSLATQLIIYCLHHQYI